MSSRYQQCSAAERTVAQSGCLLFSSISKPSNSVITAGLPEDENTKN